jgi:hypothetical protein
MGDGDEEWRYRGEFVGTIGLGLGLVILAGLPILGWGTFRSIFGAQRRKNDAIFWFLLINHMPKCSAVKANYLPCTSILAPSHDDASKQLCGSHSKSLAKDAAKEQARKADNTSALNVAADRTNTAFAVCTITPTPGNEKEYAEAKAAETALKLRVKTEDTTREKEVMTQKCKEAIARKLYEKLNFETDSVPSCYVIASAQNTACEGAGTNHDHLCDTHRVMLVNHISVVSMNNLTVPTPNMLPFRFPTDLNNHILYETFRECVESARIVRFGAAAGPPSFAATVAAATASRRIAPQPVMTAPVDVAPHIAKQHLEMSLALSKPITCPICYDPVNAENIVMTHCGHIYCTPCLNASRNRERKCPQCRVVI